MVIAVEVFSWTTFRGGLEGGSWSKNRVIVKLTWSVYFPSPITVPGLDWFLLVWAYKTYSQGSVYHEQSIFYLRRKHWICVKLKLWRHWVLQQAVKKCWRVWLKLGWMSFDLIFLMDQSHIILRLLNRFVRFPKHANVQLEYFVICRGQR